MSDRSNISLFGICPLTTAQSLIFGKWKLMVVYYIGKGNKRFSAIKRNLPDCSEAILSKQLRELEQDGIITRTVFCEVPPHVEYSLTDAGEGLMDIIRQIAKWGTFYIANYCTPEEEKKTGVQ